MIHTLDSGDREHAYEQHLHGHVHGIVDPVYLTTARGLGAVKWSFVVLAIGALLQLTVVMRSGSIALLADTIHNAADAATAIPLAIAFVLMRRRPTARFTYGYGRVEDLAGVVVVSTILVSAIAAGYESLRRMVEPRPVHALGAVALAAFIGFVANEAAALLRTTTGKEIHSAALIADGDHARVDGLASLAVAAGAGAVKLGFPLADPIVGLGITIIILAIVWHSARSVFTRLLDGIDPDFVTAVRHAGEHVPGIREVPGVRARWLGHRMRAEADIAIDPTLSVREGIELADQFRDEVMRHLPMLSELHVGICRQSVGRNQ
jgi:cation diffusion facilitator family transporter